VKKKFIAKYEVLSGFASGPSGELFKAKDPDTNRLLLIKLFYKNSKIKKSDLEIFKRKSSLISTLKNKNVATVYSAGKLSNHRCYVAFRLIEGEPLSAICSKDTPNTEIINYFYEAAGILDELHLRGVSHGNLKLTNIIIGSKNKKLYLTDFNLFQDDTKVSSDSTTNDLFLFAVALYTALMGKLPFGVKSISEIINDTEQQLLFDEIDTKYTLVAGKIFKKAFSRTEHFPYDTLVSFVKDVADACEIKLQVGAKGKTQEDVATKAVSSVNEAKPEQETRFNPQNFDPYHAVLGAHDKNTYAVDTAKPFVQQNAPRISNLSAFLIIAVVCIVSWYFIFYEGGRTDFELETMGASDYRRGVVVGDRDREIITGYGVVDNVAAGNKQHALAKSEEKESVAKPAQMVLPRVQIPETISDETVVGLNDKQILYLLQAEGVEDRVLALVLGEVSRRGDLSFYTPLQALYNNRNSTVRGYVALALKHDNYLKQKNTLTILISLLHDNDYIVRGQAAKTLGKLGTEDARKNLYNRLSIEKQQLVKNSINNALGIAIQ
jgi:hypothetical protein